MASSGSRSSQLSKDRPLHTNVMEILTSAESNGGPDLMVQAGSGSVRGYLHNEVGVEGDAYPFQ